MNSPIVVGQVGPHHASAGGMASVIREYLRFQSQDIEVIPLATWYPGRTIRSVLASLRLAAHIALRGPQVAQVMHVHLSERGSFLREGLIVWVAWVRRIPVVATLHGADFSQFAMDSPQLAKQVLKRTSHVLCLGAGHQGILKGLLPSQPTSIVLNPVLPAASGPTTEARTPGSVVFAGEVGLRKGFDTLLEAWNSVILAAPNATLDVYGPITGEVVIPDIPSIHLFGAIDRNDLRERFSAASVTVLPSRREVLPMTILESLSVGTPVIATAVGEYTSLDGCPGITWLAQGEDLHPSELADAIVSALGWQPETNYGAIEWISLNCSEQRIGTQARQLYLRLHSGSGSV